VLELASLSKRYGDVVALDDLLLSGAPLKLSQGLRLLRGRTGP
jgi:hypothetical protein